MKSCALLMVFLFALLAGRGLGQVTLQVPSAAYPTIQSALNAASTGDTVQVAAGTYMENLVWPPVTLTLQGAGKGLSIIDGNQSGSCILFNGVTGNQSVIDGFTLTNGSGFPAQSNYGMAPMGGGLHITNALPNPPAPTVKNCLFTLNVAMNGGAVFVQGSQVSLIDCDFDSNSSYSNGYGSAAYMRNGTFSFLRCQFTQHGGNTVVECPSSTSASLSVVNCLFEQNSADSVLTANGYLLYLSHSQFLNNSGANNLIRLVHGNGTGIPLFVDSCLIADNSFGYRILLMASSTIPMSQAVLSNNTIVRNTSNVKPVALDGQILVTDNIIRGNRDPANSLHNPPVDIVSTASMITYRYSNIQGMAGSGPGVVNVSPQFVNVNVGDYRLRPGSPMIDSGSFNFVQYTPPTTDIRGLPRIRGGGLDIGAYEAQALAHHPASAGQVGAFNGGPHDLLKMNGSHGGLWRRVSVPIGTASTLSMDQPPTAVSPVQFSVFGVLGEANFDSVVSVPLGIGDMMFAPAPMIPFLHPSFFTLASTLGPLGFYSPLFSATPTPWNSGPGPAISFPLVMTLQGIIEESPGVYVPTNALIFEVK